MKRMVVTLLFLAAIGACSAQTTYRCDTLYSGDSIYIVETACAPICSSCVRVYNKEWKLLGRIPAPWPHAVFPEAWIEDKRIRWRDNTAQWDEEIQ